MPLNSEGENADGGRRRLHVLASAEKALESAPATEIVAWAWHRFGLGLVLASSFQDCVLIDIVVSIAPRLEVVFIDTQYHFPETLRYVEEARDRYDLNLKVVSPLDEPDDRWRLDANSCCHTRKVEPFRRALEGKSAWMSGVRRAESVGRARTPVVSYDGSGLVKINPLVRWTDDEVDRFVRERELPVHPLSRQGYPSIGCWPCTRVVLEGEESRAGRWSGSEKTECGLHG